MSMIDTTCISPAEMELGASDAAALLKALSNERRLLILCHLIAEEELSVGKLVSKVGLSQSALSQHLAKLRDEGLVTFRREAQTLFYRVCDERAASILVVLHQMFCADAGHETLRESLMAPPRLARENGAKGG